MINFLKGRDSTHKFSTMTCYLLAFYGLSFSIFAAALGHSSVLDLYSWFQVVGLIALFIAVLWRAPSGAAANILVVVWFQIIFFLPRLLAFIAFPREYIAFIGLEAITPQEAVTGLRFIFWGNVALFSGIWVASLLFRRNPTRDLPSRGQTLPIGSILVFWVLCLAATYYIVEVQNVSIYGSPENWGSRSGWVTRIFDTDAALLLLMVWFISLPERNKQAWIIFLAVLTFWVLIAVYQGSRGGPLRLLLLTGLAAVVFFGDPKLRWRSLLGILTAAVVASVLVYPIGTIMRTALGGTHDATAQVSADWARADYRPDPREISELREQWEANSTVRSISRGLVPIVLRLGVVDYPIWIVNRPADPEVVEHYLSVPYSLKNYANNMVPGEIFPEYDIMTSRVFTLAYREADESHIRSAFLSEPWTSWGYAWLKGGMVGGLVIMAAFGVVSQGLYQLFRSVPGPIFGPYFGAGFLFMFTLNGPLQLFGLDHLLTVFSHYMMSLTTTLVMIIGLSYILSRLGIRSRIWVIGANDRAPDTGE